MAARLVFGVNWWTSAVLPIRPVVENAGHCGTIVVCAGRRPWRALGSLARSTRRSGLGGCAAGPAANSSWNLASWSRKSTRLKCSNPSSGTEDCLAIRRSKPALRAPICRLLGPMIWIHPSTDRLMPCCPRVLPQNALRGCSTGNAPRRKAGMNPRTLAVAIHRQTKSRQRGARPQRPIPGVSAAAPRATVRKVRACALNAGAC